LHKHLAQLQRKYVVVQVPQHGASCVVLLLTSCLSWLLMALLLLLLLLLLLCDWDDPAVQHSLCDQSPWGYSPSWSL
jgi:ABC-type transport system involved in cytochrome bd biosynthesis fused ATPase/permease subunit